MEGRWIDVFQAARRLGVSPSTVRRRIEEGVLPAVRYLGSHMLRIRPEDLDEYIRRSKLADVWDGTWRVAETLAAPVRAPGADGPSAGTRSSVTNVGSSPGSDDSGTRD